MVGGHSHSLINTVVNGIPIVQARSSGRAIAVVDIPLPRADGGLAVASVREILVDSMKPVASLDSIIKSEVARIGPRLNERITVVPVDLPRDGQQYALGNIVADAFRWAGKTDFAIENTAGIRAPLRAGAVTYAQLFEVQPFGNTLMKVRMRGWQFREYLERIVAQNNPGIHVSGFTLSYNPRGAAGERIVAVHLPEGRTLSDAGLYTVAVNDYMLGTDAYRMADKEIPVKPLPVTDFQAVAGYLRAQPKPLAIPKDARLIQVME